jgi:DNA polymerase III epsilon subunit family exonuclease
MQLSFDAADRLVDLLEARRGSLPVDEAARTLFALTSAPTGIARSLLEEVVAGDARLTWRAAAVGLARPEAAPIPLERAHLVVLDLETTGLSPATSRICEIGAQRVRGLELEETFETFVDPGSPLPPAVTRLTGIDPASLRGAPRPELAVRRLLDFAGDAALVAHNARFDLGFLDREVVRLTGRRVAVPVVDTVWLARRLLGDRVRRVGLASLAHFFGVPTEPCHRALPDAKATAEILLRLIGLAQERGAATLDDLVDLSAPRARRLHGKRSLVAEAPTRPGTYVFRDASGQALYVGRARELRARLRSYFAGGRQRPAVEAALGALDRVDWEVCGSELEAAFDELRLLRELRPPANARSARPDRYLYLARHDGSWRVSADPTPYGPLRSRGVAQKAARALDGHEGEPAAALAGLRQRMRRCAASQRFEDAAHLRDRLAALEQAVGSFEEIARRRRLETCLLVPAREPGFAQAFFVVGGRVAARRRLPYGGGALAEAAAGIAEAFRAGPSLRPEDADELSLVAQAIRRPPPELAVCPLEVGAIAGRLGLAA